MSTKVLVQWLFIGVAFFCPKLMQAQHIHWTSAFQGQGTSQTNDICTDAFGNVFVLGSFLDTVDFNAGTSVQQFVSIGHRNLFLVKYDSTGQMLWARQFKGSQDVIGSKMVCDYAGSIYVAAKFMGSIDANPGVGVSNFYSAVGDSSDIILIKLNSGGNLLWAKQFTGTNDEGITDMAMSMSGELVISAYFTDSIDANPGSAVQLYTTDSARMKSLILRLNSNGNYLSSFSLQHTAIRAGIDYSRIQGLCISPSNEIIITGNFLGQLDMDSSANQQLLNQQGDSSAIFVAAFTSTGQCLWSEQIGSLNTRCWVNDIVCSTNQYYYITGSFQSSIDFDAGNGQSILTSVSSNDDAFVLKLKSLGQFDWVRQLGGNGVDEGISISVNPNEYAMVAGSFSDVVDFGINTTSDWHQSAGGLDGFLVTLNANGTYHEGAQCSGLGDEVVKAVCHDNAHSIYTTGDFFQTGTFSTSTDTMLKTANSTEVFFQRLSSCIPVQQTISLSGCHDTLNGIVYQQSGVYFQYYSAVNGCDSILEINYTGLQNDSVIQLSDCHPLNMNGQLLDTTGVYFQQWTNGAGCDSVLEIHFTRFMPQDSFLTITTCDSVEYNGIWYTTSGQINQLYTNTNGCDSIFHLTLVVNSSSNTYLQDSACGNYVFNSQTYTTSGNYVQTFQTINGCDSNIYLQLIIHEPDTSFANVLTCGSYTLNGQTYTQSGTYQQNYLNNLGCDSVVLLSLQLLEAWSQQMVVTSCDSFQFNGISYTHGGAYIQHYTRVNGCDSNYNLSLTLLSANDSVIAQGANLQAYVSGAIYQWLECPSMQPVLGAVFQNFSPTKNGDYALAIEDLGCKDTSVCFTVTDVGMGDDEMPYVQIFPNPASDVLHIHLSKDGNNVAMDIVDVTGKITQVKSTRRSNDIVFNVGVLTPGLYYLRMIDQGRSVVYKWMKE